MRLQNPSRRLLDAPSSPRVRIGEREAHGPTVMTGEAHAEETVCRRGRSGSHVYSIRWPRPVCRCGHRRCRVLAGGPHLADGPHLAATPGLVVLPGGLI